MLLAAALLAAGVLFASLRDRTPSPGSEEIDEASKEALREILRQEEE